MNSRITMDREEAERSNKARRAALILAFIGLVIVTVLIFLVPGVARTDSMDPVVNNGDLMLMNRMAYSEKRAPDYGDITYIKGPGEEKGKEINVPARVIGNDGDVIELKGGDVYRNGELLDEPYAEGETLPGENGKTKFKVPKESAFVLGDNRDGAYDSRDCGCVSRRALGGKATFRILPFSEFGTIK